jgi:membrane protein YqaA with SNARE-associated domain
MHVQDLLARVGIYAGSFIVGFVSGLVPFVNAEVFLVAVSPITPRHALLPVAVLCGAGQMCAKTIIFYAGRGVFKINMGKLEGKIEAVQAKFQLWQNKAGALIFLSAVVGMPPFYVVSFVAGALKLSYVKFLATGFPGRCIRFGVIIYFPQLILRFIR